jgi:hypothetical protein
LQHFRKDAIDSICKDREGPLSIRGIRSLLGHRYEYAEECEMTKDCAPPLLDAFSHMMICESRYSRYWFYPVIFRFRFGSSQEFREELLKFALVYSVIYAKTVYEARSCVQDACRRMFEEGVTIESVLNVLREKRASARADFERSIRDNEIAWNRKWKLIACRLSEFLEYTPQEYGRPNRDVFNLLFVQDMDIEHIQSYHDKYGNRREKIWSEWAKILNGIGNLTMLEENINRSISNEEFSEKVNPNRTPSYCHSNYRNVKKLAMMSTWTKEQCEERRNAEVNKIMGFLF